MKHLKIIGLAAVAAMALMAFAGTASATVLTSPTGTQKTSGEIASSAESSLTLKAGFANITCTESSVAGTPSSFGGASATVSGPISTLTFTSCGGSTVTVIKKGSLEIHSIAGTENGTLTGKESEVTVAALGTSCVYGTGTGTHLGVLTGGAPATMDISAELTKISGGFLCANPAHWEGSYNVTTPSELWVS